jgi:trans-aconitate methyltransferase
LASIGGDIAVCSMGISVSNHQDYINEAFSGYAEAYYQREIQDPRMPVAVEAFMQQILPTGWLEDWGCGPGHWSEELKKYNTPHLFKLIEVSEGMLEKAETMVPGVSYLRMDIRQYQAQNASISGIMMGYLIPYLTENEMLDLLNMAVNALLPGGCLLLAYMAVSPRKSFEQFSSDGKYKMQMNYHDSLVISQLLSKYKLNCVYKNGLEKNDHVDIMEIWKKA